MSHTQVQWGRGSSSQLASYTGPAGELVLNTEDWSVLAHDGATAGGWPIRPRLNVRTVTGTGAQAVAVTDDIIAWNPGSPASVVFTLPVNPRLGETHGFKYLVTGGQLPSMTIAPAAGATIDGQASVSLSGPYQYLEMVFIGSNSWIVK